MGLGWDATLLLLLLLLLFVGGDKEEGLVPTAAAAAVPEPREREEVDTPSNGGVVGEGLLDTGVEWAAYISSSADGATPTIILLLLFIK